MLVNLTQCKLSRLVLAVVTVTMILPPTASYSHGGGGGGHGGGGHGGGGHAGGFHSYSGSHFGSFYGMSGGHHGAYYGLGHGVSGPGFSHYGIHHRFGQSNNWGVYYASNHWNGLFGYWGSWSNPWLNSTWGWGAWGTPLYAAGTGFASINPSISSGMVVDEEGNIYPGTIYRYDQTYLSDFNWNTSNRISASGDIHDEPARYRLGPDAEIINGGMVAIGVCDTAYLLVSPKATQLISSESGLPIVSLYTDPSLTWHLSSEMKRQILGLESAIQSRQENQQQQLVANVANAASDEVNNLQAAVDLLKQAQNNLGAVSTVPPQPVPPVVPNATELFAGTWVTPDGKLVALKRADGSIAYTDGNSWYSDQGKTPMPGPDAAIFKQVVTSYINGLLADAPTAIEGLKQDKRDATSEIDSAKADLDKLEEEKADLADAAPDEYIIAKNRCRSHLDHLTQRLNTIDKELAEIPKDVNSVKALLKNWQ